jgi:UDP-glucose 4-epimerase
VKILLTGAAGFLGAHAAGGLMNSGHEVDPFDVRLSPFFGDLLKLGRAGHLNDDTAAAVHCAAIPDVRAKGEAGELWAVNVDGTRRLLDALPSSVRTFVFLSSSCVYGDDLPLRPDSFLSPDPLRRRLEPVSLYGASKLAGEALVSAWAARTGARWVALRPCAIYGGGYVRGHVKDFVQRHRASRGEPIMALDDGSQRKAGVHVGDVVSAIQLCLSNEKARGPYDVAGEKWGWYDTARLMGIDVRPGPSRSGFQGDAVREYGFGCEPLRALGWSPKGTVENGVRDALASLGWSM